MNTGIVSKQVASHFGLGTGFLSILAIWILTACGNFTLDPPAKSSSPDRRAYVNDSASADSLTPALIRTGVKFVMQPGKAYQLSVNTDRSKDHLTIFYYRNGATSQYQSLAATLAPGKEIFPLVSDQNTAQLFLAQLVVPDGLGAIKGLGHVSLISFAAIGADTLHLRLIFVRKLMNLPDSISKADFARRLFAAMAPIYSPYGIVLVGTYEIVEPTQIRMVFPFSNAYVPLPGTRVVNNAHIYMVDTISIGDPGSGLVGEVLGFAPREVVDLDQDNQSRVVLANPYPLHTTIPRLAITAAHELGHFFGLRHTVSTQHDLLQDDDFSNTEDGFTDTDVCNLNQVLIKKSAAPDWIKKGTTPYCLRMADNSCNGLVCDLKNLMHPVDCGLLSQTALSPQQANFLKKNLATYRH